MHDMLSSLLNFLCYYWKVICLGIDDLISGIRIRAAYQGFRNDGNGP